MSGLPEWLLQLLAVAAGGVAAYTAIRADIARLTAEVKAAVDSSDRAHGRIDAHLSDHAAHMRHPPAG